MLISERRKELLEEDPVDETKLQTLTICDQYCSIDSISVALLTDA